MKRGKRSADDRARMRLLELWQRRPDYGDPVGCIATTYTFDAAFFEDECLARFVGMDTDRNEDPRAYVIEREDKLSEAFAAVIVDQSHVPSLRSLRWHVFPARVENGGILHAKLGLLVWRDRIRVVIASANLSDPGYRKNLEHAGHLDFTPDGEVPLPLLFEVLDFVEHARQTAPGADAADGPHEQLRGFLRSVRAQVQDWAKPTWKRGEPWAALVETGPGRPDLFEQMAALWPFAPATHAMVVSPFFDDGARASSTAKALEAILIQRGDQEVTFLVDGRVLPDGVIQLDMPASLKESSRSRTIYRHERVMPDEGEDPRPLHAKTLWLQRDEQAVYLIGSSNFTQAGTAARIDRGPINIELNIAYVLPSFSDDFGRVCDRTYPNREAVDVGSQKVQFLGAGDRTPEPAGFAVLPACFTTATLRAGSAGLRLELAIEATPPAGFAIALPGGAAILSSVAWESAGQPPLVTVELGHIAPPTFLGVVWDTGLEVVRATWPVNVADRALLPPPEDLRDLSLEDLLELLTSARPAHEVMARIIKRREAVTKKKLDGIETDPHKKIDTKHHLLKRMRRAAAAMEELRARLERPAFSLEALRSRLHGPLGPLALAAKLVEEEPAGASFMIAELAMTIGRARLAPKGELTVDDAKRAVDDVIRELQHLAARHPAPPNLAQYVAATFEELQP